MRKKLLFNLILTLLLSIAITGVLFSIWYNSQPMGFEERQAMLLFFTFLALFQNLIMALFTLPVLFLINEINYTVRTTKLLYSLASPVFTTGILMVIYYGWDGANTTMLALLVPAVSFGCINALLYKRWQTRIEHEEQHLS